MSGCFATPSGCTGLEYSPLQPRILSSNERLKGAISDISASQTVSVDALTTVTVLGSIRLSFSVETEEVDTETEVFLQDLDVVSRVPSKVQLTKLTISATELFLD